MRSTYYFAAALIVGMASGPAFAANICQANNLTCATTMPIGGYCECTAHGNTQSGTVVSHPAPGRRDNATAGGCGAHPNAPGCPLNFAVARSAATKPALDRAATLVISEATGDVIDQ